MAKTKNRQEAKTLHSIKNMHLSPEKQKIMAHT